MGKIIKFEECKEDINKVILTMKFNVNEHKLLNGITKGIHIFSEEGSIEVKNISKIEKNSGDKIFILPRDLRNDIKKFNNFSCQRIDCNEKSFFIFFGKRGIFG